jgi:beta-N-acetylhexosaminidase
MKKITLFFTILIILVHFSCAQKQPPFLSVERKWADSLMQTFTLEEKIGQLIMVTSMPQRGEVDHNWVIEQIEKHKVGGVLFLRSSPTILASLVNTFQEKSKTPLFIAIDAENGLSFRMDSVTTYPNLIALGATSSDTLIYSMGREIGQQCKRLGINVNFAPVADVNSNSENPVINFRSFGENPEKVSEKTLMLAKGMQDEQIFVTLKHFPGHGNTTKDSHHTLPVIDLDYKTWQKTDLIPFKKSIDAGINGIMTAHILVPSIDKSKRPATLSKRVMTGILKDSLGFSGLIFSDGMNMKGITNMFKEEVASVEALKAGVDVLEFVLNPEKVIEAIKKAIAKGELTEKEIEEKCLNVLLAKKWVGLDNYKPVDPKNLINDLNKPFYELTARQLTEQSVTILNNTNNLLPLSRLDTLKIASVAIGSTEITAFQTGLDRYMNIDHFTLANDTSLEEINLLMPQLNNYNLIIASIHNTRSLPQRQYGVTPAHIEALFAIGNNHKTISVFFSNPYSLQQYKKAENPSTTLILYEENLTTMDIASQAIFGAINVDGLIPVTVKGVACAGSGEKTTYKHRLKYTLPEETGIDSRKLYPVIDSMIRSAIQNQLFPGCQLLIAKNGKVILNKAFGYHAYDSITEVKTSHLYDWASITKITGALPILMKWAQDSIIRLDEPVSTYWPPLKKGNKSKITFRELLAHQSGLKPGILFHSKLVKENHNDPNRLFSETPKPGIDIRISNDLYTTNEVKEQFISEIFKSDLQQPGRYNYSDLGFYLLPEIITTIGKNDYEQILYNHFFKPLGINNVLYNPFYHLPLNTIVPTEYDRNFRKGLVHGFVHDEGAALLNGISGNAGLFGNANELAKIMQFYLQNGFYGDFNYLNKKIVDEFTKTQFSESGNRRGLGFDKPTIGNENLSKENAYPALGVSKNSFGHSGFTGTITWADPETGLLIVFLSNRVYPTRNNNKLNETRFRSKLIQTVVDNTGSFTKGRY